MGGYGHRLSRVFLRPLRPGRRSQAVQFVFSWRRELPSSVLLLRSCQGVLRDCAISSDSKEPRENTPREEMATVWATGVVVPVINGQGLGVRAAAAKKQSPKGATAKKSPVPQKDEKGFLDRILEWMDKESFSETDPVLKKGGDDKGVSSAPPPPKKGGFFGFN